MNRDLARMSEEAVEAYFICLTGLSKTIENLDQVFSLSCLDSQQSSSEYAMLSTTS
jgi:hypothetical protein